MGCDDCGIGYDLMKKPSAYASIGNAFEADTEQLRGKHYEQANVAENNYAQKETVKDKYGDLKSMDKYSIDLAKKEEEKSKNPWDQNTLDNQLEGRSTPESKEEPKEKKERNLNGLEETFENSWSHSR